MTIGSALLETLPQVAVGLGFSVEEPVAGERRTGAAGMGGMMVTVKGDAVQGLQLPAGSRAFTHQK